MVWGAMLAAGVGPLCFIKGRVNAASHQEILEHFMLPLLKSFMEMKISFSARPGWHLLTVPKPLVNGLLTMVLLCSIGLPTLLT